MVDNGVDWLTEHWAVFFSFLQSLGQTIMDGMTSGLSFIPPLLFIVLATVAAFSLVEKMAIAYIYIPWITTCL